VFLFICQMCVSFIYYWMHLKMHSICIYGYFLLWLTVSFKFNHRPWNPWGNARVCSYLFCTIFANIIHPKHRILVDLHILTRPLLLALSTRKRCKALLFSHTGSFLYPCIHLWTHTHHDLYQNEHIYTHKHSYMICVWASFLY